jgi:4-amino-4-deoxy-L-arabinose transferase-like glycosyltransferase
MSVQTAMDRMESRVDSPPWSFGLAGVISVGLLYGLVYSGLRLSISHNLATDDVLSNVYAQSLELGYIGRQPPLYEWLLWLVQRFTGPTLLSFLILKYSLLAATFVFLYLVAKRVFADPRWATLAALSPLMLYQIGWNVHEGGGVTQTGVLMCAVAASTWAIMRLVERGTTGDYLLFGLIAGLGLISKYSFAGFLFVLLASALLQPALRARILNQRMFVGIGVGAAVTAPIVYWLITKHYDLVDLYNSSIAPMAKTDWFQARAIGLGKAIYAPLAFLFPLDAIVVFFPGVLHEGWSAIRKGATLRAVDRDQLDWQLLLLRVTLGGFIVLLLGAVATGATHYLERYMHPFFLLTPLWLLGLVEKSGNASRRLAILASVFVAVTLLVVPLRLYALLHGMGPECRRCRIAVPYHGLAAALEARGFHSGTIIAADRDDAGNLRRIFPEARIVRLGPLSYAPLLRAADFSSKVAVVWRKGTVSGVPKEAKGELARVAGNVTAAPERVSIPWRSYPPTSVERVWEWVIVVADPGPKE